MPTGSWSTTGPAASIYEGRARGMTAWCAALSTKQVWILVAYIRLLSGTTGLCLPRFASPIGTTGADAPVQSDKRQP
jgi:hypothetical protein